MAQAKLISPVSRQAYERTKVAAYCRVSSNSADQLNSYATQIRAYTKLIKSNDSWELVEIFADEGLSGMKAENRVEFQRMIEMCEHMSSFRTNAESMPDSRMRFPSLSSG